jgi:hypothetical protein
MLEAPQNPLMCWASSGMGMGPGWQNVTTSELALFGGVA